MNVNIPLKNKALTVPIIQGGMGVGISLSKLASAAINQGCMGVISAAQPGYREEDFMKNTFNANIRALKKEVENTRKQTKHQGILAVNVMVAARRYKDYIEEISKMDIDCIISGAGLPLDLPSFVKNKEIMLVPIVSSAKAAYLICKGWDKRYNTIPDFIIIEGSLAGGHLGFRYEDLVNDTCESLEVILEGVLEVIKPYQEKYNREIPVFVAGGIRSGYDIAHFMKRGASGAQIATRFIATHECDADDCFKQAVVNCKQEDIAFTKSPSKLHGRALKTNFMIDVNQRVTNIKVDKCVACLSTCNPMDTAYCITDALIQSVQGNTEQGIVFVGARAHEITEIVSVKELVDQLKKELSLAYGT